MRLFGGSVTASEVSWQPLLLTATTHESAVSTPPTRNAALVVKPLGPSVKGSFTDRSRAVIGAPAGLRLCTSLSGVDPVEAPLGAPK
jgi:hypothetical protein